MAASGVCTGGGRRPVVDPARIARKTREPDAPGGRVRRLFGCYHPVLTLEDRMHFDAHQPVIDDLEARILTIRDSL